MAKKAENKESKVKAPVTKAKTGNLSERKSEKISIQKYLQLYVSDLHLYHKAYLGEQFRGIMKTKEAWQEELKKDYGG